jgi:hypothetical protein
MASPANTSNTTKPADHGEPQLSPVNCRARSSGASHDFIYEVNSKHIPTSEALSSWLRKEYGANHYEIEVLHVSPHAAGQLGLTM